MCYVLYNGIDCTVSCIQHQVLEPALMIHVINLYFNCYAVIFIYYTQIIFHFLKYSDLLIA